MEIKTKRLTLRPLGVGDLESTHLYASDVENTKWMTCLPSASREETKDFLLKCQREWQKETPGFYEMAIIKEGIHIGAVSIYLNQARDTANLGWILRPGYHGLGYATEAASAMMGFARQELGIRHFTAHCDAENTASERVMRKLGLQKTDCYGGRKNRISHEERQELSYELYV